MAYVQPNSIVQLFKGINLDNRYMHTIYFRNEAAQNEWFTSKVTQLLTFNNQMYKRYTRKSLKIEIDTTSLIGVTYMRFKNTRTSSKWFYAFVTAVDYVNENTSIVYYEIDVMQTWFMQGGDINPCFVLREHVSDDTFGTNLETEPIGAESYDCDALTYTSAAGALFGSYDLIINTSEAPDPEHPELLLNNGLVNGTKFHHSTVSSAGGLYNIFNALVELINGSWDSGIKPIEVVDMFMFPTKYSNLSVVQNEHPITITHPATIDGYTPKNKKLFGYPFSYLQATTKNGSNCAYLWEYFDGMLVTNNTVTFKTYGNPVGGGQIRCYPSVYNGIIDNIDASLIMDDFPKSPFAYDAYQAWVAAGGKTKLERAEAFTKVRGVTALATSASNAYMSGMTGINQVGHNALALQRTDSSIMDDLSGMSRGGNRIISGAASLVNTVVDVAEAQNKIAYAWKDAKYQPNITVGTATPNLSVAEGTLDFYFYSVHVRLDELKRLDDFLSCFGYAINKVKRPNLTGRRYWNFVQTQNSVITGNMPASSKEAIGRIFDGGITFWHNGDNVGNYAQSVTSGSINNPIVS